jgi:hypothetical protein
MKIPEATFLLRIVIGKLMLASDNLACVMEWFVGFLA